MARITIVAKRADRFADQFIFGDGVRKKTRRPDSFDGAAKKFAIASWSAGFANRIDAVVPSRKINRPDCGASWVGTGI
jgi:hypothetical protein